jgi:hypothetical protein
MSLYVKVVNGLVVQVWDTPPSDPIGTNGWFNAVEIIPELIPNRQTHGQVTFDTTQDPVVISREVIELTFEQCKEILAGNNEQLYSRFLEIASKNPAIFTAEEISATRAKANSNRENIAAATTFEQLDSLVIQEISLF